MGLTRYLWESLQGMASRTPGSCTQTPNEFGLYLQKHAHSRGAAWSVGRSQSSSWHSESSRRPVPLSRSTRPISKALRMIPRRRSTGAYGSAWGDGCGVRGWSGHRTGTGGGAGRSWRSAPQTTPPRISGWPGEGVGQVPLDRSRRPADDGRVAHPGLTQSSPVWFLGDPRDRADAVHGHAWP